MRIIQTLLAIVFLLCTIVQFNDDDALPWIFAYGLVAVLFLAAVFGRYYRPLTLGLAIILTIWMLFLLPGFVSWVEQGAPSITGTMKAETPHVELVREFLGLFLAVLALMYLVRCGTRAQRT